MSKERIPAITGLGMALGKNRITNADIDARLGQKLGMTDRLMRMSGAGIKERNWVDTGEQAVSDLAVEATLQALEMAGLDKNALKTIVVATSSADYVGVPAAAIVQHKLGLPTNVRAFDAYAACPGWVQALQLSFVELQLQALQPDSHLIKGGPQAIVGAEVISPVLSPQKKLVYPLFADAAGTTITDLVTPDAGAPTNIAFDFGADGQHAEILGVKAGGSRHPSRQKTLDEDMHTVDMTDGPLVARLAVDYMSTLTKNVFEKAGVPAEEVTLLFAHQANEKIIRDTADAVNFPQDKVFVVVDRMGNTSAASIPTAMRIAWDEGKLQRNQLVAFASFGAGMNFGAGIMPMVGLPKQ